MRTEFHSVFDLLETQASTHIRTKQDKNISNTTCCFKLYELYNYQSMQIMQKFG